MKTVNTLNLIPVSEKNRNYIINSFKNRISVAEGAVRAGKTIDNCIAFALALCTKEDKIHLASGSTLPNAKLNIGECNGFLIVTEINENYDSDDSKTSFIKVVMARQLASKNHKIYWDLNPSNSFATNCDR